MPVGTFFVAGGLTFDAQTVRLSYNVDALDFSPLGPHDALNPNNYDMTVVTGSGSKPNILRIVRVPASTVAFDVQVDRPLLSTTLYRTTVQNVTAELGDPMGFPNFADTQGVFAQPLTPRRQKPVEGDFALDILSGRIFLDSQNDIAVMSGKEYLRKRIVRRCVTTKGAFYHLPDYGVGLVPKQRLLNAAKLGEVRAEILSQIRQEDDLLNPEVSLTFTTSGVLTVDIRGTVRTGEPFKTTFPFLVEVA
jgi:hypothetical protein